MTDSKAEEFDRSKRSLENNIEYWAKRQSHEDPKEAKEATLELKRCEMLLAKLHKNGHLTMKDVYSSAIQ